METLSNTTNMTIRIDKDLKKSVDTLFKKLGTSTNSAINMYLKQCEREQSLVFTASLNNYEPNEELMEALKEMEDYKSGKIKLESYKDVKSLRKSLLYD